MPNTLANVYAGAAPGANTDILATGFTPGRREAIRVTVALTTSSVLNVTATDSSTSYTWGLNSSTALNAKDLYTFTFGGSPDLTYNFQVETDGVIELLLVEGIRGEVL